MLPNYQHSDHHIRLAGGLGGLIADEYGLIMAFYFMAVTIIIANVFVFLTPAKLEHAQ